MLRINEIFKSIQGEGFNTGKEVIFIRLSGCNLSCKFCDTDFESYTKMNINEILTECEKLNCKSIILTGGEPTIQDIQPLIKALSSSDYWIGIESNGTGKKESYENIDFITISPKSKIKGNFNIDELKIVNNNLTVDNLKEIKKHLPNAKRYTLSPMEQNNKLNIRESLNLLSQIKKECDTWTLSLQTHKLAKIR